MIFHNPNDVERLAKAVATAHAAGVPPKIIEPAEISLQLEARKEEQMVNSQVSELVTTLDRLQSAGTQARRIQSGLESAGLATWSPDGRRLQAVDRRSEGGSRSVTPEASVRRRRVPSSPPRSAGCSSSADALLTPPAMTSTGQHGSSPHSRPTRGSPEVLAKLDSITEYLAGQQNGAMAAAEVAAVAAAEGAARRVSAGALKTLQSMQEEEARRKADVAGRAKERAAQAAQAKAREAAEAREAQFKAERERDRMAMQLAKTQAALDSASSAHAKERADWQSSRTATSLEGRLRASKKELEATTSYSQHINVPREALLRGETNERKQQAAEESRHASGGGKSVAAPLSHPGGRAASARPAMGKSPPKTKRDLRLSRIAEGSREPSARGGKQPLLSSPPPPTSQRGGIKSPNKPISSPVTGSGGGGVSKRRMTAGGDASKGQRGSPPSGLQQLLEEDEVGATNSGASARAKPGQVQEGAASGWLDGIKLW